MANMKLMRKRSISLDETSSSKSLKRTKSPRETAEVLDNLSSSEEATHFEDYKCHVGTNSAVLHRENFSPSETFSENIPLNVSNSNNVKLIKDEQAVQDLRTFKSTEELFRSNVFRLQMEEMLKEIRVSYSKLSILEKVMAHLKSVFSKLEEIRHLSWEKALEHIRTKSTANSESVGALLLQDFSDFLEDDGEHLTFSFIKPEDVAIVGSLPLHTCSKPIVNIDLTVEMPKSVFESKDYLNCRYFRKRAFYLAEIAIALEESGYFGKISYDWFRGDRRRPILLIHSMAPGQEDNTGLNEFIIDKSHFVVRIIPCIDKEAFKLSKLSPARQNLRNLFDRDIKLYSSSTLTSWPTPFYNSALLSELFYKDHLDCAHEALLKCPSAIDAILLLKTWLRQRNFSASSGAFDGFLITMLVAYLIRHRKITKSLSSYQIFRLILNFIATHNWLTTPLVFERDVASDGRKSHGDKDVASKDLISYQNLFPVVFLDSGERLNLTSHVSETSILEMQREADSSLRMLNNSKIDCFSDLFLKPRHRLLHFDVSCCIRLPHKVDVVDMRNRLASRTTSPRVKTLSDDDAKRFHVLMDLGSFRLYAICWFSHVLRKALKDRAHWIHIESVESKKLYGAHNEPMSRSETVATIDHTGATTGNVCDEIFLGLCLNSEQAFRLIDHGPQADDTLNAKAFQDLWGEKAELRRFKDGMIREVVSWETSLKSERLGFYRDMIEFLIRRHALRLPKRHIWWLSPSAIETHLSSESKMRKNILSLGDMNRVFFEFSKQLRQLPDLPLTIISVQPARYYTSSESINSVEAGESWFFEKQPYEITVRFESNNQWPNSLEAIRVLKTAFYLRLAEQLKLTSHILYAVPTPKFLDVVSVDKVAFRLKIVHEAEFHLLHNKHNQGKYQEQRLRRDLVYRPQLAARLQSVAAQFPMFHDVLKLAREWFDGHFFSSYIFIEIVDLLVAHMFVDLSQSYVEPIVSDIVGFYRFIQLLATHNWQMTPLLVNFDQSLSVIDVDQIQSRFDELRRLTTSHHAFMYIATPDDKDSLHWTWDMPNKAFLSRLVHYAQRTLQTFQTRLSQWGTELSPQALCLTPLSGYDVLLHLKTDLNLPSSKKLSERRVFVGFDPLRRFVDELRQFFGEFALFFFNPSKVDVIAMAWKPGARVIQSLKFKNCFMSLPDLEGKSGICVHYPGILQAIRVLGDELIQDIVVLKNIDDVM